MTGSLVFLFTILYVCASHNVKAQLIDYGCLQANSWVVNTDGHYNSYFSSLTGVQTSAFVNNSGTNDPPTMLMKLRKYAERRKKMKSRTAPVPTLSPAVIFQASFLPTPAHSGTPPTTSTTIPPTPGHSGGAPSVISTSVPTTFQTGSGSSGGSGFHPTPAGPSTSNDDAASNDDFVVPNTGTTTVGWQIQFTGIPDYDHNITSSEIAALNSRPEAYKNFVGGATSATVGEYVVFGQNIGYTSTQCTLGYWPSGPVCPAAAADHQIWTLEPAPEMTVGGCYVGDFVGIYVSSANAFSWTDNVSYDDQEVWNNLAMAMEEYDMDICVGHAADDVYHHHSYSPCLAGFLGDTGASHSPVYGFAFDGFPIYGPYEDTDLLAVPCWQKRNYTRGSPTGCADSERSCQLVSPYNVSAGTFNVSMGPLLNGTVTTQSGNVVSAQCGIYFEDYWYNSSCTALGGRYLDQHNGHFHEPYGYHYHTTINSTGNGLFPYSVGPTYYGCIAGGTCSSGILTSSPTTTSICGTTLGTATSNCTSGNPYPSARPSARPSTLVPTGSSNTDSGGSSGSGGSSSALSQQGTVAVAVTASVVGVGLIALAAFYFTGAGGVAASASAGATTTAAAGGGASAAAGSTTASSTANALHTGNTFELSGMQSGSQA